jgi:hypothetical protein
MMVELESPFVWSKEPENLDQYALSVLLYGDFLGLGCEGMLIL